MEEYTEITLEEVLAFREERVRIQQTLLEAHRKPLVSFCMNIPGPVKTSAQIRAAFDEGVHALKAALSEKGIAVLAENRRYVPAGDELVLAADTKDASALKDLAVQIEEEHPAGRLFDLDVLDENGRKLSRKTPRKCIVCGEDVLSCSRSRAHSLDALSRAVGEILQSTAVTKIS